MINWELCSIVPETARLHLGNDFDKGVRNTSFFKEIYITQGCAYLNGFAPQNRFSLEAKERGIRTCIKNCVRNAMITMWGDDGKECSYFSALPSLYAFAQYAKGNFDKQDVKQGFFKLTGISFDDFMLLDLLNEVDEKQPVGWNNPSKYIFYNDLFLGLFVASFVRKRNVWRSVGNITYKTKKSVEIACRKRIFALDIADKPFLQMF